MCKNIMNYHNKITLMLQMRNLSLMLIIILFTNSHMVSAIIGYDCSQQVSNLTTFSLMHVGECDIKEPIVTTTKEFVRLLQLNEFTGTQVKLCKVEIKREIKYCGHWSHTSDINRGEVKYLNEITREECKRMHIYRSHIIHEEVVRSLKANGTVTHPMTFSGLIDKNGNCKNGATYTDPYGTFDDVLVTGYVTITLQDYYAPVNLNTNEIVLKSGTRCELNKDGCIDIEAGYAFWEPLPIDSCEANKYSELYKGYVNKVVEEGSERYSVYIMESGVVTFAFTTIGTIPVCSYELIRTEHPKLFFLEGSIAQNFNAIKQPSIHNLDIFAYVNSKFVYVEKHIKGQLKRLYHDIIMQKCELERRIIANALSIATTAPDMFAYQITKKSGYMSLVAGEVVHLMRCVQVDVRRREAKTCYQELPVTKDGQDYFLTPRTHILKQYGTETTCNILIPPMFLLGNDWFTVLPKGTAKGITPAILKPNTKKNWNYTEPAELAKSGIYTHSEIQALRQHLMFPVERSSMLNTIALGMSGKSVDKNGLSIARLFDEEALSEIATSTGRKIWAQIMTFGSASAAVIGLVMIGRMIKFLIDTIIHGYALYSLYGWSLHIIGAIWNSVTQLLLHVARDKPTREQSKDALQQRKDNGSHRLSTPAASAPVNTPNNTVTHETIVELEKRQRGEEVRCTLVENRLYSQLPNEPDIPSLPAYKRRREDDD